MHLGMVGKVSTLCSVCLHIDEQMEYSHGGAVIVPICMYNCCNFGLVKRYDQCRFFSNINRQEADDADTDFSEQLAGPACNRDDRSVSVTPD